jgi:hypothetical protein
MRGAKQSASRTKAVSLRDWFTLDKDWFTLDKDPGLSDRGLSRWLVKFYHKILFCSINNILRLVQVANTAEAILPLFIFWPITYLYHSLYERGYTSFLEKTKLQILHAIQNRTVHVLHIDKRPILTEDLYQQFRFILTLFKIGWDLGRCQTRLKMRSSGKHVECRMATPKGSRRRKHWSWKGERERGMTENGGESGKCKEFRKKVDVHHKRNKKVTIG